MAKKVIRRKGVKSGAALVAPTGKVVSMVPAPEDEDGNPTYATLRLLAAKEYVCSPEGLSVRQIHEQESFKGLSIKTLEKWCLKDRWAERRREWRLRYSREIESEMSTTLVRNRMAELALLEKMQTAMDAAGMEAQKDGSVKFTLMPKTMESFVRARLDLGERIDALRQSIGDTITPQPQVIVAAQPSPQDRITIIHPNMRLRPTDEEAYAMINAMLDVREREQARRLAEYEANKGPDPYRAQLEAPKKKRPPPSDDSNEDEENDEDDEA